MSEPSKPIFNRSLVAISTGAVSEIRAALDHVASETEHEFEAALMRIEALEFKATGVISKAVHSVERETETIFSDVKVEAHHVGMTFTELLYALRHPVRAGAALKASEESAADPTPASAPEPITSGQTGGE